MFPSILAIGRKLNVIFGCAIWLAVAIFFAVVLLGSLWLDVVGGPSSFQKVNRSVSTELVGLAPGRSDCRRMAAGDRKN